MRSGLLAVYEVFPVQPPSDPLPNDRTCTLLVQFVKVVTRAFDIQVPEEQEKSVLAEVKKISRHLIPFVSSPAPGQTFSGVFFTGDRPCWIIATDKGGVKVFPSGHSVVHAFTASSLWESRGDFLLYSEEVRSPASTSPSALCITSLNRGPAWSSGYPTFNSTRIYRRDPYPALEDIHTWCMTQTRR